ncbi:MAG: histidine phosphatase family protein [Gammaproteobacteria bacterium]|jgi:probable phosphoglycerate mutase
MELILIRHGLPQRIERRDGAPADPPLSEHGRDQATLVGGLLARETIDAVYASPMRRAFETADPFAAMTDMRVEIEAGVAEFDQHSDTYIPMEELKRLDYEQWRVAVQGGFEAEHDIAAFRDVVVESLERIIGSHQGGRVAVFCHGGVINIWTAHLLGMGPRLFFQPDYTSVNRYLCARTGERNLVSLNETGHLK